MKTKCVCRITVGNIYRGQLEISIYVRQGEYLLCEQSAMTASRQPISRHSSLTEAVRGFGRRLARHGAY